MKSILLAFIYFIYFSRGEDADKFLFGQFPSDFRWGASTAAYQIEGGWNADGKGPNIWDYYVQQPGHIADHSTGDIACDSYRKYREDVQLLKKLGVNTYRFSISWARILPTGSQTTNPGGIQYYKNLIAELKDNGIEPFVTLYHNDLPEQLQRYGGWLNPRIVTDFANFAKICFQEFGNDVKNWITINEPWGTAALGYGKAMGAPGVWGPGTNTYIAGHNLIKAHVAAYRLYQNEFKTSQGGQVGITLNCNWFEPKDPKSGLDVAAQERGIEFLLGWFANAILVNGDYPQIMKDLILNKTHQLSPGQPSRLPTFTEPEKADNKDSADFLGLNFYSSWLVTSKVQECNPPTYDCDSDTVTVPDTTYYGQAAPSGLRKMLNWIKKKYNNINVYITENGASDTTGTIQDEYRIGYMRNYTNEALKAITLDSCNLKGYMVWSLMDNFEWTSGFSVKYGLYHVDFTNPDRPRSAKSSVTFYKKLIADNGYSAGYNMEGGRSSGTVPFEDQFDIYYGDFPTDFKWGVKSFIYKNFQKSWKPEDGELLKTLGVKQYQMALFWESIFSDGTKASYNKTAMEYYKNVISELKKNNIEPVVVLYSGRTPLALGVNPWLSTSTIDHFVDYADICFKNLGDMVKMWITFEDPLYTASEVNGEHKDTYPYINGRNLLLAHARVYKLYTDSYKATQKGKVGIEIDFAWAEPSKPQESRNVELAERYMQMRNGWFASPIFGTGDYPEIMKHQMEFVNRFQKLENSRLPELTSADQQLIKGSSDFLKVKYIETVLLDGFKVVRKPYNITNDRMVETSFDPSWLSTGVSRVKVAPFAIRKTLNWIKNEYKNPPVYVISGIYDTNGTIHDDHRIHYYRTYINNVLKATNLDGCNVKGFSAYLHLDGYDETNRIFRKSGLYRINVSGRRVPKSSANWYALLTHDNGFKPGYNSMGGRGTAPAYTTQFLYDTFPKDFIFSVATAATQIEGAWDEDGKGKSIWDVFAEGGNCKDGATPKKACDSYHRYKEDVQMVKDLGVQAYRFSIAWTRIMPDGTMASKNQKGIDYYNNLINELIANGIKPMVTIYHWDLPQALQNHGGWLNESIIQKYQDYAGLLFSLYGDRVDTWITLNEPWVFTYKGYGGGSFAPGIKDSPGVYPYIVAHNAIRAHAAAYHQYHDVYKGSGKIGITLNIDWQEPKDSENADDVQASDWALQTFLGWFAHPIYVNGDYPEYMKTRIAAVSAQQGLSKSRLPEFTPDEMRVISGSSDFFGLNSYSTNLVEKQDPLKAGKEKPSYMNDRGISSGFDPSWENTGSDWLKPVPYGLRKILNWIKNHYGNPEILITENGVSDNTGDLDDSFRTRYIGNYVNEVLKAIKFDNVNVIGYTLWSLMDNFEWARGYSEKFGLYNAGPQSPKREPKSSATYYAALIKDHGFVKDALTDLHPASEETELSSLKFPDKFSWGSSVVGYGESPEMRDLFGQSNSTVDLMIQAKSLTHGEFSAYGIDDLIDMQKFIKINATHAYMSLKWSMILPNITADQVNKDGVDYVKSLLSELSEKEGYAIDPIVSLYWWNLPADLETKYGGWLNESTIDLFVDYARICFKNFGHEVKYWITFDEPADAALNAYERGVYYPLKTKSTDELYRAVHNIIKAHVRVYHMYQREFKHEQKGSVGIALNGDWFEPYNNYDPADYQAALRAREFQFGWIGDPLLKRGDYPKTMKERIGSRLPIFSPEEQELNKGAYDFIGLAHYAVYKVQGIKDSGEDTSFDSDRMGKIMKNDYNSENYKPWYIRRSLQEVKKRFGKVPIFISGNSISDSYDRIEYIKASVNSILEAIRIDGCDVKGYTYSPLVDGTIWKRYMYKHQGLYQLAGKYSFKRPKAAASYMRLLASNNGFPPVQENTKTTKVMEPSIICVSRSASPTMHFNFTFVFTVIFVLIIDCL
ncbi:hypothetical protein LOTGIDRAFT_239074 [Lottia gigantea]|uniref:beta-glucosidase n=1 Tax=Lottia gigantea TaxID=225164 RepID=V4ATE7_LOTGI|nr:hypothetical protein LOTGIDRAFT_239074 [Lottia gigantea]ESO98170.1 hypothetical protein LOTGIDRAFT_239074 [Lottia gigantea]